MSQTPLHRDLLTDEHLQRTGFLTRKQAGALARLKVMAELWGLENTKRLVKETVAFGASVEGRRARDIVEVLSAHGYDGDRLDALMGDMGGLDDLDDSDGLGASEGRRTTSNGVTNRQKPDKGEKKRRSRFGYP